MLKVWKASHVVREEEDGTTTGLGSAVESDTIKVLLLCDVALLAKFGIITTGRMLDFIHTFENQYVNYNYEKWYKDVMKLRQSFKSIVGYSELKCREDDFEEDKKTGDEQSLGKILFLTKIKKLVRSYRQLKERVKKLEGDNRLLVSIVGEVEDVKNGQKIFDEWLKVSEEVIERWIHEETASEKGIMYVGSAIDKLDKVVSEFKRTEEKVLPLTVDYLGVTKEN